ncbi:hypothetical protein GRI44_07935 [Altererythrobacter confluentis]|uniref:Uncharacterized protein n=1 Tax=Allopontixanthobacter confluentis TaxID=1849021 RepID=A0A6L7GFH6_9SPHN|nr:hypothetical protein [Allopontixanthobacter confluentis]
MASRSSPGHRHTYSLRARRRCPIPDWTGAPLIGFSVLFVGMGLAVAQWFVFMGHQILYHQDALNASNSTLPSAAFPTFTRCLTAAAYSHAAILPSFDSHGHFDQSF